MARSNDRDRKRAPKEGIRKGKKKVDIVARDGIEWVDYKDVNLLRKFMSDRGKIRARRVSGNCAQHQRDVAIAIKTARELALLPFATQVTSSRGGGRGGGRGRDRDDRSGSPPAPSSGPPPAPSAPPPPVASTANGDDPSDAPSADLSEADQFDGTDEAEVTAT